MISSIETKKGQWILLVGPRSMNSMMQDVIIRLGEQGALRVLDGGQKSEYTGYTAHINDPHYFECELY